MAQIQMLSDLMAKIKKEIFQRKVMIKIILKSRMTIQKKKDLMMHQQGKNF
jgi:hypothetical protein